MTDSRLDLVLVNTPIGCLGSGRGGGVELTFRSVIQGLVERGHRLTVVTGRGSKLPRGCSDVALVEVDGEDQPSWQHADSDAPVVMPRHSLLPQLWQAALSRSAHADAVLNFGYDWLPLWITPFLPQRLFHLISMGAVTEVMREAIETLGRWDDRRLAFHTRRQAADFSLPAPAVVVGNGFDVTNYVFQPKGGGPLGWAGRIAPEKGLEDAAAAAAALGDRLLVWGFREDEAYAAHVEATVPSGTIEWRGFLATPELQQDLGLCRALINTPKWNEAYGNVVVEAMACGVPVIAYDRGGPGELIEPGLNGWLVPPDDVVALESAITRCDRIDRFACRQWVESHATYEVLSRRIEAWIRAGLMADGNITAMQ